MRQWIWWFLTFRLTLSRGVSKSKLGKRPRLRNLVQVGIKTSNSKLRHVLLTRKPSARFGKEYLGYGLVTSHSPCDSISALVSATITLQTMSKESASGTTLNVPSLSSQTSSPSLWDRISTWASEHKAVVYTIAGVAVVVTGAGVVYYLSDSRQDPRSSPTDQKKPLSKKEKRKAKKEKERADLEKGAPPPPAEEPG